MPFLFTVNSQETNITYEAETVEEGMAIRTSDAMVKALQELTNAEGTADNESTPPVDNTTAAPETPAPAPKTRGRPKKNQPDPATATAPAPAPVPPSPGINNPAAPPSPPAAPTPPAASDDLSIPGFLRKNAAPVAPVAPTPPSAPPAPPAPPSAPSYVLGNKIKAHIEGLATTDETKTTWRDWLASPGVNLVVPAATFEEAMGVLQFTTDTQAAPVAKALSLS